MTALEAELARQRARLADLRELLAQQTRCSRSSRPTSGRPTSGSRTASSPSTRPADRARSTCSCRSNEPRRPRLRARVPPGHRRRDREIAAEVADARVKLAAERRRTQELRRRAGARYRGARGADGRAPGRARRARGATGRARQRAGGPAVTPRQAARGAARRAGGRQGLELASAELADRIRSAQGTGSASTGSGAAPASGFIWPVEGPITSPFGYRWGRMHEGIDIGVGFGTPIRAAAAAR